MSVELLSVSPSPSRDQDVFGKELRLSESERKQLASAGDIFLSKTVNIDTHSKKGDGLEPRTLVISSSRCYILIQNPATKVETSFNFLRIQELRCSNDKITFLLAGEGRPRELLASRQDSVEVIALITAQLKNVFPKTPLDMFLILTFEPDSLREEVSRLRDELTVMMERVDASTVAGFLIAYGFICDFFGVEFNREVSWYMKNVYLAHGLREMKFSDFEHLPPKDFLPVVSSLRHNHFFEGILERDGKFSPELVEELSRVLGCSHSIKTVTLSNCGLKPDSIMKLSNAIKNNPRTSLTHLDWSENMLDDRAVETLSSALETLPHGLQELRLANCKLSVKGASALANCMKQNKHMEYSLVHLDLSSNPLGPDPLGSLAFIQASQTISTLNLSNCGLLLENVVPVLNRGCTQHLRDLNFSSNIGRGKRVVHSSSVASGLEQFCRTSIAIRSLNLSSCKLTSVLMLKILEGLAVNPNVTMVKLDVSANDLGGANAQDMLSVLGRVKCLYQLNISECGLDLNMADIVRAVSENRSLCHLMLGKNFSSKSNIRMAAVQQLSTLLAKEDCQLLSLCLGDSQLKEHTSLILDALVENNSLAKLNISGNSMGNRGARSLAKALLSNCALIEISWDHNDTQLRGFQEVSAALQQNYTLRVMPLPLHDISRARRGVEDYVQTIQQCLCRNHSDERLKVEIAARHRSRLLTASQQSSAVGRELVQLEDLLEWLQKQSPSHELMEEGSEVKELANRAIKLTDGLYSPKVESEQFRIIAGQVRELLDQFMEGLFVEHIKTRSKGMVDKTIEICDSLISEETQIRLQNLVVCEKGSDFTQAKKDVLRHALPEIVNHVSDSNVEVAANISELVVEHTLHSLERMNHKLFKLQKEARVQTQQATDAKVSRNFTFRVQEDTASPAKKKKKRVRRADPEDGDDDDIDLVDLPTIPLTTEGPALEHLGKTRPKPARMQRSTMQKGRSSKPPAEADVPPAPDPAPADSNTTSKDPPASDSTPPVTDSAPSQPAKVAMKPPSPLVAEKMIKELLEKKRSSTAFPELPSAKSSDSSPNSDKIEKPKSASLEQDSSDEGEQHRSIVQPDSSEEEQKQQNGSHSSDDPMEKVEEHRTVSQEAADDHPPTPKPTDAAGEDSSKPKSAAAKEDNADETDKPSSPPPASSTPSSKPSATPPLAKPSPAIVLPTPPPPGQANDEEANNKRKSGSDEGERAGSASLADWEVIDTDSNSKKPAPAVKEKPRKSATVKEASEGKKTPILPLSQIASLENLLQKGSSKAESLENGDSKESPPKQTDSKGPKSSPSPAPKPRPKPSRKKAGEKQAEDGDSTAHPTE